MMKFYIKAKVTVRVFGISGPFEYTASYLVNDSTLEHAKLKFEDRVRWDNRTKEADSFHFEYLELASEI
jgi:hypothetical protein